MSVTDVSHKVMEEAVCIIRQGGVVAFPTETYYGLAVDPFNEKALERLFLVKQRPTDKAILNLIDSSEKIGYFSDTIPSLYQPLIERFWPGPLTLLFEAKKEVPDLLECGNGTVGLRVSSHPVAYDLCQRSGKAVTATSANLSGLPAATTAAEVRSQLGDVVDLIIDGGKTPGGKGSTIVGVESDGLKLLRDGVLPFDLLS